MKRLGTQVSLRSDFCNLLPHFWKIYSDPKQNPKIRLEAARRISEVYSHRAVSLWTCLSDVTRQLRPMRVSTNQSILEGFCTILNGIFRNYDAKLKPHFDDVHLQRKHGEDDERQTCDHCQVLVWMFNILKRVNKVGNPNKLSAGLLRQVVEFFIAISTPPPMGNYLIRNNILGLLIRLVAHPLPVVHKAVLELLGHLTTLDESLACRTADKRALFKALSRLREATREDEHVQDQIGEVARRLVSVRSMISFTREHAQASKDVTMKIFQINRWVR